MNSSEKFRYVALRIGSSEVLAELPDHARTILLDPRAKMAEAQLISVSDLPDYAWLNDPLLDQKAVEISQQSGLALVIGPRKTPQRDEAMHLLGEATVKF